MQIKFSGSIVGHKVFHCILQNKLLHLLRIITSAVHFYVYVLKNHRTDFSILWLSHNHLNIHIYKLIMVLYTLYFKMINLYLKLVCKRRNLDTAFRNLLNGFCLFWHCSCRLLHTGSVFLWNRRQIANQSLLFYHF